MIIFDETVVSGTVLLRTPLLKSTTLSPPLRTAANQVERSGRRSSVQPLAESWRCDLAVPFGVELRQSA
jgi:hypothetical protein